jgi:DNA-binding response OmpR family regulator
MKHILLLEDEHDIAIMLRRALEEEGYFVTFSAKVADARTVLARVKVDLLISNILLPTGRR